MFGQAMVQGTLYNINKGTSLVQGVSHEITEGKTLIDGTDYIINQKSITLNIITGGSTTTTVSTASSYIMINGNGPYTSIGTYSVPLGSTITVYGKTGRNSNTWWPSGTGTITVYHYQRVRTKLNDNTVGNTTTASSSNTPAYQELYTYTVPTGIEGEINISLKYASTSKPGDVNYNTTDYTYVEIDTSNIIYTVPPTLEELISSISEYQIVGNNSSEAGKCGPLSPNTSYPNSYLFSVFNGYASIYKVTNGVVSQTSMIHNGTYNTNNCAGLQYNSNTSSGGYYYGYYFYPVEFNQVNDTYSQGSSTHGATIINLDFEYPTINIDEVLQNTTLIHIAGHGLYTGGTGYNTQESTTNKDYPLYLVCKGQTFDFWKPSGSTYTKVIGTTTAAGSVSGGTLSVTAYGCSIIALTDTLE